jgi:hypothetical protein
MSAATSTSRQQTKIFGIQLGVDPKILVAGLIVLAGLLFWFNSRGDESSSGTLPGSRTDVAAPAIAPANAARRAAARRNRSVANDRGVLRIRPVDATHGDIDPTLRLELLARLQSVAPPQPGRSLFEIGPEPAAQMAQANMPPVPKGPKIPLGAPQPAAFTGPVQPQTPILSIPLKFYGFVRPAEKGQSNQGFFLDGDNIIVASEGDVIDHRYLVRELSATTARVEDTQVKRGQTLPVVPEARPQ